MKPLTEKAKQKIAELATRISRLQEGRDVTVGAWRVMLDKEVTDAYRDLELLRQLIAGDLPIKMEARLRKNLPKMKRDVESLTGIMLKHQAI